MSSAALDVALYAPHINLAALTWIPLSASIVFVVYVRFLFRLALYIWSRRTSFEEALCSRRVVAYPLG